MEIILRGSAVPCRGIDTRGVARAGDDVAGVSAASGSAAWSGRVCEYTATECVEEAGYCGDEE